MNVLVAGGSGFVGRNLASVLTAAGHRVVSASRRTGVDFRALTRPADWCPHLDDIDAVINCVGIIGETGQQRFLTLHRDGPTVLFSACARVGIRRVIQISALGADDTAFSAYHISKRAADEALRALDVDGIVLRPSLIYGRGGASSALFLRLAMLPRLPLIGDGRQRLQPIHIADVAATVLRCLEAPATQRTLDIVGPETVSFADWLGRMRAAQGLAPARHLKIPPRLAAAAFTLARHFHPLFQPENLRMLLTGYHADAAPITAFLGRPPLAWSPKLFFADALEALS